MILDVDRSKLTWRTILVLTLVGLGGLVAAAAMEGALTWSSVIAFAVFYMVVFTTVCWAFYRGQRRQSSSKAGEGPPQ